MLHEAHGVSGGIYPTVLSGMMLALGNQRPYGEVICEALEAMRPIFVSDHEGVILWARYRGEIDELRARGLSGDRLGHELALRSALSHEHALGLVRWMENAMGQAAIRETMEMLAPPRRPALELAAELEKFVAPPRPVPRKTAPPVPPWARERGRRRVRSR